MWPFYAEGDSNLGSKIAPYQHHLASVRPECVDLIEVF
jgi:hypothetical protein